MVPGMYVKIKNIVEDESFTSGKLFKEWSGKPVCDPRSQVTLGQDLCSCFLMYNYGFVYNS